MKDKTDLLKKIYRSFEDDTRELTSARACNRGCSFCCEAAGSIDITTLEGLAIREAMAKLPRTRQAALIKAFRKEIRQREAGKTVPCPFLLKNKACLIYEDRPFSCRRIYSAHVCTTDNPPAVSRQVMDRAAQSIRELQALDHTGYSGHLSYILYMLSVSQFMATYMAGGFKPEEIMDFGRSHHIAINRKMI